MSPEAAATDQVYLELKSDIMRGRYAPTMVLNVHATAAELGVSVSPVRDAMERLVGERMLAVRPRGGFSIPAMSTTIAQDLYRWHAHLTREAVRSGGSRDGFAELAWRVSHFEANDDLPLVAATGDFFDLIGGMAGNPEHLFAIHAAGERLHALRLQETPIKDRRVELTRLASVSMAGGSVALRNAIMVYHRRRLKHLKTIVSTLHHQE